MTKVDLLSLEEDALKAFVASLGEAPYRARQIHAALREGRRFEDMTTLSKALREKLQAVAVPNSVTLVERLVSARDDTQKLLFALQDENIVEGVLMRHHHGDTMCLSTQVGCSMGCVFCASTIDGCVRNITAAEMLGQVILASTLLEGRRLKNVVLMGSGEPLQNYDEVVKWIRMATDEAWLNLSVRGISLSTCGLVDQIDRFSGEGLPITLCISLHAPNDEIRRQIMPIAKTVSIDSLFSACRRYIEKTGRRVIFEYALIEGINCEIQHADELASRLRHMQCHVNLIPLNAIAEGDLRAPSASVVNAFVKRLNERNISSTLRRELGEDIAGACGQLRRSRLAALKEQRGDCE